MFTTFNSKGDKFLCRRKHFINNLIQLKSYICNQDIWKCLHVSSREKILKEKQTKKKLVTENVFSSEDVISSPMSKKVRILGIRQTNDCFKGEFNPNKS